MLLLDVDVGHCALTVHLLEGFLDVGAVVYSKMNEGRMIVVSRVDDDDVEDWGFRMIKYIVLMQRRRRWSSTHRLDQARLYGIWRPSRRGDSLQLCSMGSRIC